MAASNFSDTIAALNSIQLVRRGRVGLASENTAAELSGLFTAVAHCASALSLWHALLLFNPSESPLASSLPGDSLPCDPLTSEPSSLFFCTHISDTPCGSRPEARLYSYKTLAPVIVAYYRRSMAMASHRLGLKITGGTDDDAEYTPGFGRGLRSPGAPTVLWASHPRMEMRECDLQLAVSCHDRRVVAIQRCGPFVPWGYDRECSARPKQWTQEPQNIMQSTALTLMALFLVCFADRRALSTWPSELQRWICQHTPGWHAPLTR
ncbi:hypothetical protein GGX14DRAFT_609831 [Mycena pura]|uniref:Uncharacterized protein n=1 Tax=Mycena pura TaxID=153505 RepID=A0AAD6YHZ0_9AGAR|nr:hypothetical protein GGX14DRAFT_609831 [Mycena pura]